MFVLTVRNTIFDGSTALIFDTLEEGRAAFSAMAKATDGILYLCLEGEGRTLYFYDRKDDPRFNPEACNVWAWMEK